MSELPDLCALAAVRFGGVLVLYDAELFGWFVTNVFVTLFHSSPFVPFKPFGAGMGPCNLSSSSYSISAQPCHLSVSVLLACSDM